MKRERRVLGSIALACGLLAAACGGSEEPADGQPMDPADVPQPYLELAPGPGGPVGVVLETMNVGMYTYARLGVQEGEIWMAGPMSVLAVDDTVYLAGSSNMGVFRSDELDRQWDEIYFIDAYVHASAADGYRGEVAETMNVAGYTYLQVDLGEDTVWTSVSNTEGPLVWLAGPEMEVSEGDMVLWTGGAVMRDFHSSTLDRTFAEIVFVGSLTLIN